MKWHGVIGYRQTVETSPSVWTEEITERNHYGDVNRNTRYLQSAQQVNDNVNISNVISVVANPYAMQNFHSMIYIEFMGTKWKITNVDVQYPRLIITMGGLYNG